MNKVLAKLLACILALVVSASLMVMSSYAWLTIAGAPEVDGIQINIGGSNTILLAADVAVQNENGTVSHYPGTFDANLNFAEYESYSYLDDVAGLLPVSTTDGVHWVLPAYYSLSDSQVQAGQVVNGMMKDIADFSVDTSLGRANLTQLTTTTQGNYVYLDFWVVSPGADYQLRVSTGEEAGVSGSYVIGLPSPEANGNTYSLSQYDQTAAASIRVGFLVNSDWADYDDVQSWAASDTYSGRYTQLVGQYQEAGESAEYFQAAVNHFTIYEPNGDLHPALESQGNYLITKPLTVTETGIAPADISDRLSVQLTNRWKMAEDGVNTMLQQEFSAAIAGRDLTRENEDSLWEYFYKERMQSQLAPYVERGWFVANTARLYAAAQNGQTEFSSEALRTTAGATEDVYITTLRKNVPQRIRMFIWLEGQDVDCINHTAVSSFAISLELAGSNDQ